MLVLVLAWLYVSALLIAAPCSAQGEPKRVNAHLANEVIPLSSNATTVGGFLSELSVSLPPGALVDPPLDSAVKDGMSVFLSNLSVTRGETLEQIPVEIEIVESHRFGPGGMELESPGRVGLQRVKCTIFYFNNSEVGASSAVEVLRQMKPMRIAYYHELSEGDGPTIEQILEYRIKPGDNHTPPARYQAEYTMKSTAYEPGPQSCGRSPADALPPATRLAMVLLRWILTSSQCTRGFILRAMAMQSLVTRVAP